MNLLFSAQAKWTVIHLNLMNIKKPCRILNLDRVLKIFMKAG
jgi:hypothetical protein